MQLAHRRHDQQQVLIEVEESVQKLLVQMLVLMLVLALALVLVGMGFVALSVAAWVVLVLIGLRQVALEG